ncbi:MAG: class I SAM-dependent methyltransferase [Rhodospirillales bacterium]|nr:class I SAM-dependent methyltransferase [Rhodospirillales bacterium]
MSESTPKAKGRVNAVYKARSRDELEASYDDWADDFDHDAAVFFGWRGPQLAFDCFQRHVAVDARILDAGAGTGLLGQLLRDAGYGNLTGFDLSRGMLEKAEQLGVYQALHRMALGETLDFTDDAFDATACIGTLTTGHAPAEGIDELVRVTRSGGVLVVTLNLDTYSDDGIRDRTEALEAEGRWSLVESSGPLPLMPVGEPEINHEVRVYRVG